MDRVLGGNIEPVHPDRGAHDFDLPHDRDWGRSLRATREDAQHVDRQIERDDVQMETLEPVGRPAGASAEIENAIVRRGPQRLQHQRKVVDQPRAFVDRLAAGR